MRLRQKFALGSLAVLGLVAAAAMGLLANAIAGDSIGLSAKPLRAGHQLAPAVAGPSPVKDRQRAGSGSHQDGSGASPPVPPSGTAVEPGDDHGGAAVDNSGPGSLNSGSGSSGEGSGSSGSGSSGSSGSSGGSGDD
jgi:hypothetical protein